MARLAFEAVPRALDANANPVANAQLRVYVAGTTTGITTYKDKALTTAHAFPVLSDAAGVFPEIYVPEGTYKVRISSATGVTMQEADYISNGEVTQVFDTVAALKASTMVKAGDWVETRGYYAVGDLGRGKYQILTLQAFGSPPDGLGDHTITSTVNGNLVAKLAVPVSETPYIYGAKGNGVYDDTAAVRKCFDNAMDRYAANPDSKIVIGGWTGKFAVSSPITLTGAGYTVMPMRLKAIGTNWNVDNAVFQNEAKNSEFYSITVHCNRLSNGISDAGRSNAWYSMRVFNMSAAWLSYGYYKPQGTSNETEIVNPVIYQWNPGDAEFATPSNFTADCIRMFKSDCFVRGGVLSWARACYAGANGIHHIVDTHINNGREGIGGTDTIGIEFGKATQTGEITLNGVYIDNCKCDFYNSQVNFGGVKIWADSAKVTLTNGVMQFYANPNISEFAVTGDISYYYNTLRPDTISFIDYGTATWSTATKDLATLINSKMDSAPRRATLHFANQQFVAGFNGDNDFYTFLSNGSYVNFSNTYGGVKLPVNSTEPIYTAAQAKAMVAYSDGTSSTNNFGVAGEGLYVRTSPTNWTKL